MKKQTIIFITLMAVLISLALSYVLWGSGGKDLMHHTPTGTHRMPDGSVMENSPTEVGAEMTNMDHSAMMIESEREFLEGMIPHHQEAVDTAKEVIARGGSTPEIKKLAEDIVIAQEKEIVMMKDWHQSWYSETYVANSEAYEPMMRDLSKLSGATLDRVFLEDMIMHHMGALMMAQSIQPHIEHPEITDLTKAIVETQTEEIQLMKRLVSEL